MTKKTGTKQKAVPAAKPSLAMAPAKKKAVLTTKVLRESSARATKAASKRAFKSATTLLSVQNGKLVRVDRKGKVVEVVKKLDLPKR